MEKRQILVVTNNSELHQSIQNQMENDTTKICCVSSPSKMLQFMSKSESCLVILDLQLPGIEMLEMVRIIRISQQAPILALTDSLESAQKTTFFYAGVNAFL